MTLPSRLSALSLAVASALVIFAAAPASAAGRDAAAGLADDLAVVEHAGAALVMAKDNGREHRGARHDGRRDHRADRREDRWDHRADRRDDRRHYRDDRRDHRGDRRDDRRDYRDDRWDRRADRRDHRRDYRDDRRHYRDGYRDGRHAERRHSAYRYKNRWGYRPGHHVHHDHYVVIRDYGSYGYRRPPYGHGYVRIDGDVFLVALATGLIVSAIAY